MADYARARRVAAAVISRLSVEGNELTTDSEIVGELETRVATIMEVVMARREGPSRAAFDLQSMSLGRRRAAEEIHPSASLRAASVAFEEIFPALLGSSEQIMATHAVAEAVALQEVLGEAVLQAAIGYVDYLLTRLDSVHLQERRILAAYLHDRTAQDLASAIQRLEYPEVPRDELRALLEVALGDIRGLALNLRQFVGEQRLDEAIELHISRPLSDGVPVRLHQVGAPRSFSLLKQEATFLIVRELVLNARKHANASRILVGLDWSQDQLTATVEDDGRGFDQTSMGSSRMGLLICRERAESMSADLEIESGLVGGTVIRLTVPI